MEISGSALAHDVIFTNARQGTSGFEVAQGIKRVARDLEDARRDTHAGVAGVLPSGVQEFVRSPEALSSIDIQVVETILQETASDIQSIVGGKEVAQLDDGVAGQAYQGVAGSSQIDVTSSIKEGAAGSSIIDAVWLSDVVDHEKRHEAQASSWNADEVLIEHGGSTLTLTRRQISEADAMLVQSSIENVSWEYQQIFQTVTGIFTNEQICSVAESGDLSGLAEQMQTTEDTPLDHGTN